MRNVKIDNIKSILIALVIIGHTIEPLIGRFEWIKSLYLYIYFFHIPVFAYISGVLSSNELNEKNVNSIIKKLIIPYFFLEITYSIFDYLIFSRHSLIISPLVPYWILWYIFSLILWKTLLPFFNHFKYPIILSIIAGLACGVNHYGYNLSFSRTFVFFPFFLIGHYKHSIIEKKLLSLRYSKLLGWLIIIISLTISMYYGISEIKPQWLYGSTSYSTLGVNWYLGFLFRCLIYVISIIIGLSIISIINDESNLVTSYGRDSLYIYVLHGFIMKLLIAFHFYRYINNDYNAVLLIIASLLLLPLLSSFFAKKIANYIMNPFTILLGKKGINFLLANKSFNRTAGASARKLAPPPAAG